MDYSVEVEYKDDSGDTQYFDTEGEAIRFAKEEIKWEGTRLVVVLDWDGKEVWAAYGEIE